MQCSYCNKEIDKEYDFFEINDEFYCKECVEENYTISYSVGGEFYDEDEVQEYSDFLHLIKNIDYKIEQNKAAIEYHKKQEEDEHRKSMIKYNQVKIKELEKQLEELQNSGE